MTTPHELTLRELLAAVAPAKLAGAHELPLADALHDSEGGDAPLLVRLFLAIGTWIGALMISVVFVALHLYDSVIFASVVGAGLFIGAVAMAREPTRSLAQTQVIWAMSVGAMALLVGLLGQLDVSEPTLVFSLFGLSLAMLFLVRVPSLQVFSAFGAVGFATWFALLLELPMFPLWVAVPVAAIATAAWIFETRVVARIGRTWSAIAYGLPVGVAGPLSMMIQVEEGGFAVEGPVGTIATLVMLALIGVVLEFAKREQAEPIEARTHVIGVIAVLAVLAARHVPGLSLALLWLLVAELRKSRELQAIALIQLGSFLLFFYYQLETTLLLKSLWVLSTGGVLLLGAALARPRTDKAGNTPIAHRSRWLPAIVLVLLTSGLVVGASVQKERVLASGQTLLLPLAPVDPRSLMQGDYMVLRYALEQQLGLENFESFESGREDRPDLARHGRLVLALDDQGVGRFVRFDDGSPLAEGELRLEYRLREGFGNRLRIGADSFLFEEGSGGLYEGARYGELVVAESGEAVLVGLRDQAKQPLGERLH